MFEVSETNPFLRQVKVLGKERMELSVELLLSTSGSLNGALLIVKTFLGWKRLLNLPKMQQGARIALEGCVGTVEIRQKLHGVLELEFAAVLDGIALIVETQGRWYERCFAARHSFSVNGDSGKPLHGTWSVAPVSAVARKSA